MTEGPRLVGLDVGRAIAVLGMVIVNFRGKVKPDVENFAHSAWVLDRMEGKWAAVFVVLAGMGLGLRAARAFTPSARAKLRRSLLTRAAILLIVGLVHQHWWTWDILAFYGVYIAASVVFLWAPSSALWSAGAVMTLAAGWQWTHFERPDLDFWTLQGAIGKLVLWGNYPAVPWFSLLLFGIWLARLDLRESGLRRRLLAGAVVVLCLAEVADLHVRGGGFADLPALDMLRTWPRPARPGFVVSGASFATIAVLTAVALTERHAESRIAAALGATGQLAFTVYIVHVPAVLVPQAHGWMPTTFPGVLTYALGFYGSSVAGALWWRRRFERGPLEGLVSSVVSPPQATSTGKLA